MEVRKKTAAAVQVRREEHRAAREALQNLADLEGRGHREPAVVVRGRGPTAVSCAQVRHGMVSGYSHSVVGAPVWPFAE
jgi:hypothetical protein